nr:isoprenylcysteine carboxylmethyltransferase family protein [Candidatus Freyarchaeota archaeon]
MPIKGADKLLEKLPGYTGSRFVLIPLIVFLSFFSGLFLMVFLDVLPRMLPGVDILRVLEPILPFVGTILCGITGFLLIYNVWHKREKFIKESKETAYQRGLKYGLVGIPLVASIMIHTLLPIETFLSVSPVNGLTITLSTPLTALFLNRTAFLVNWPTIDLVLRTVCGATFALLGFLTVFRAIQSFGVDYMAVLYLYYPEESELQEHEIYSVLRHPTYSGVVLIFLGAVFARFSVYSILFFIIFLVGLLCHIRLVEERELIERFGESYREYQKRVPALIVRPSKIVVYLKFLVGFTEMTEKGNKSL